jgi:hypothetical protein
MSCDLLPTETAGPHYQGDVRDVLDYPWDLMIAHPPCTHLSVSGAKHFAEKRMRGGAAGGCFVFYDVGKDWHSKDCDRKPRLRDVIFMEKARPDHSALAVWAWGDKSYLLMA